MSDSLRSRLREAIEEDLLPTLRIESRSPTEPIEVDHVPEPWIRLGTGNYAAVFTHPDFAEWVVKVYAPGRQGIEEEKEVYRRLGEHPAYSRLLFAGDGYLVLRRLHGVTLYDAVSHGIPIPERVIRDVDEALKHARRRGLHPHDVHGRNVMMHDGHGLVVDVSDFLKEDPCSRWGDLKRGYYWLYRPVIMRLGVKVPQGVLNLVRRTYRVCRRLTPGSS